MVLAAQEAAIDTVGPGRTVDDVHMAAVRVLVDGLVDLGALKGRAKRLVDKEKYKRFYMHRTGHWLGMDVHDVGDYRIEDQSRMLEPGMVMTVEPGLYVAPDDEKAPRRLRGIGIRIEDDCPRDPLGPRGADLGGAEVDRRDRVDSRLGLRAAAPPRTGFSWPNRTARLWQESVHSSRW